MNVGKIHNRLELIIGVTFVLGIVTAILNVKLAGFTPLIWFLISIQTVLVTICVEITTIRENCVGKGGVERIGPSVVPSPGPGGDDAKLPDFPGR